MCISMVVITVIRLKENLYKITKYSTESTDFSDSEILSDDPFTKLNSTFDG